MDEDSIKHVSRRLILQSVSQIQRPRKPAHLHPVLGVTELLEQVLENLPMGDILFGAQLTCKLWKECVGGSLRLKQKCFLVPVAAEEHLHSLSLNSSGVGVRPRDYHTCPAFLRDIGETSVAYKRLWDALISGELYLRNFQQLVCLYTLHMQNGNCDKWVEGYDMYFAGGRRYLLGILTQRCIHPFIRQCDAPHRPLLTWAAYGSELVFFVENAGFNGISQIRYLIGVLKRNLKGQSAAASWRTAQVSRPACSKLTVPVGSSNNARPLDKEASTCNTNGVTVAQFFQLIAEVCAKRLHEYPEDDWELEYSMYGANNPHEGAWWNAPRYKEPDAEDTEHPEFANGDSDADELQEEGEDQEAKERRKYMQRVPREVEEFKALVSTHGA